MFMTQSDAPRRPRLEGERIVLGKATVLARRIVVRGCWSVEQPSDEALSALLSLAYGSSIDATAPMVKRLRAASAQLMGNPAQAAALLSGLPEPLADCDPSLTKAEALLRQGVPPQDLAKALRRHPLALPPVPDYCDGLRLTEAGVVLGKGTIIVALEDRADGGTGLAIDGNEARIVTLLSLARQQQADPAKVLRSLGAVSRALQKGDSFQAAMALCRLGQPRLAGEEMAKSLMFAERCLSDGGDLMKTRGNPYHRPGQGDGAGQFCSADEAGLTVAANPAEAVKAPEPRPSPKSQEHPSTKMPERPDTINEGDWAAMKTALDKRTDLSVQEKASVLSIFGWEGGMKDDGKGVVAGLLPKTLSEMGASSPKTVAEVPALYVAYLDRSMRTIGGLDAVSQISDVKAASAFADTLFYQGSGTGAKIIQQAINDVRISNKQDEIEVDRNMGPGTLAAYKELANDAGTRQALLNALYDRRVAWSASKNHNKPTDSDIKRFKAYR